MEDTQALESSAAYSRLPYWYKHTLIVIRLAVTIGFGVILPAFLLAQAYQSLAVINSTFPRHSDLSEAVQNMPERVRELETTNDYVLMSALFFENANQRSLASKQRMRIAVMHIGFAVLSLGLLLILVGIDVGGIAVQGEHPASGVGMSLKIASTGVVVFLIGGLLAGAGGLIHSKYSTASVPSFAITQPLDHKRIGEIQKLETFVSSLSSRLRVCKDKTEHHARQLCQLEVVDSITAD